MPDNLSRRFWVESSLAAATGTMFVVTLFWRDWIEAVFRVDPDHGNGSLEWVIVAVLAVVSAGLALDARLEWRRGRARPAAEG